MGRLETFFRLIRSEDYELFGIDPLDVPMGTYASEDHPRFLQSRFGGNAYGIGLVEHHTLNSDDLKFLEDFDFQDTGNIAENAKRLNAVYQKLGLLIRFSGKGKQYFLIPKNLVAHSLQEIKSKADEIEELILQYIFETRNEKLDVGLLTSTRDLLVHELAARLTSHRILTFETTEQLRSWRIPLDIVVLPKDPYEYLLEQAISKTIRRPMNRERLFNHAMYLAGKIHDLLDPGGMFLVLAHCAASPGDDVCRVRFRSEMDLKHFLLFTRTFKAKGRYRSVPFQEGMDIYISDFYHYVNRLEFFDPDLKGLLAKHKLENLSLETLSLDNLDRLPRKNLKLPQRLMSNPEKQWARLFDPYFKTKTFKRKSPGHHQYWQERLDMDRELPDNLFVYAGAPKKPGVDREELEQEVRATGMQGCSLPLVAEYRNSFRYVMDVLDILDQVKNKDFPELSEHELARLGNPFRRPTNGFEAINNLLDRKKKKKLLRIREYLNPDQIEGFFTPIIEHIPKLALHGIPRGWLLEIMLIVVGHTTMSRIVFGKLPIKSLEPITNRAREERPQEILDLLRVCRLMSMAEIAASLGESFMGAQARELNRLYEDALKVAMDSNLTWDELQDRHISALGGAQNKAVREMLKFFNLFEFLDTWQEHLTKGAFEKEVICDYQPERLLLLQDALDLAFMAEEFKQEFMANYVFGQSYFFRQFLHTEFHGTGHLFPKLGTRAGFILLWIAVNACERHVINFNPMLAGGIQSGRQDARIQKIRDRLLLIPKENLHQGFFQRIKTTLRAGDPAFIYDSGLRIVLNDHTHTVDISFVDLEENIKQIDLLLNHFESQNLRGINLKSLQMLERLFSEVDSFHQYLQSEGCTLQCDSGDRGWNSSAEDRRILEIQGRLRSILQNQVFLPEEIHDKVKILAIHCPDILRFFLPELPVLGNLVENWPTRQKRSLGSYVMRCLEKFQALVIGDRNAFQNQSAFYQLAKKEFGPLAEQGIGATPEQIEFLEYLVERIQQKPFLYQAMTLSILFQEIGRVRRYCDKLVDEEGVRFMPHGARGAVILDKLKILKRYRLDPRVERLVLMLVRHHSLVGHVIQGEAPLGSLNTLTAKGDDRLVDVYVLQAILGAASIREGMMVSDLLDEFMAYRSTCFQVMQSHESWEAWIRRYFCEWGLSVHDDQQLMSLEEARDMAHHENFLSYSQETLDDANLWKGLQCAAFERLLKLLGIQFVSAVDVHLFMLKRPVNYIYHKKKLKSVGFSNFDRDLARAVKVHSLLFSLSPSVRFYLIHSFDHLGAAFRIRDFSRVAGELQEEECIKLLFLSFQVFHNYFGFSQKNGVVSFEELGEVVERRREVLQNVLAHFCFPERFSNGGQPCVKPDAMEGIGFEVERKDLTVLVGYRELDAFDLMKQRLTQIWNHEEIARDYQALLDELQERFPYDTGKFAEELNRVCRKQKKKISENILRVFQEELSDVGDFSQFAEIRRELEVQNLEQYLSEHQQFLLKELFEFHLSRIRDDYLTRINQEINRIESKEALTACWDRLKGELYQYRFYVGKEYESFIARFMDDRMNEL